LFAYAPASAVWWAAYEQSKIVFSDWVSATKKDGVVVVENHKAVQMVSGAIAGWTMVVLTNPMDVIKTRLQTQHHQQNIDTQVQTLYSNSFSAMKVMLREEGWRVFTKGIGPRLLTTTFFSSWFGLIYETVLHYSKKT